MSDTLSSLWPRFQRLPLWARVAGWLFAWPLLVPLWLLSGPQARWRQVSAVGSFVVLGFFWSAMCAGVVTGDSAGDSPESQVEAAAPTDTPMEQQVAATNADQEGTETPAATPDGSPTSSPTVTASTATATATAPTQATLATASADTWTVSRIIDGDTVEVRSDGTMETVRVVGIDTPERGECGFSEAGEALGRMVLDQPVDLVPGAQDNRDRYGRILRYLDVQGVDAGLELIRGGFAIARYDSRDGYGRHLREDTYVGADAQAIHICAGAAPAPAASPAATQPTPGATPPPAPTPEAPAGSVEVFARCSDLNAVYPGGVARVGVQGNMVSGELRPFGRQPVFDDALYEANSARDGDGDGIACEK